ncbi:hypothetical protein P7K49_018441 [Saguinus oedipus]|uniref:Uncharacterized protein n=1 Tax=Saguinus oedipus TaxID=9490 RepID=A0ABQ9V5I9_SAGOE|nr:hypothetical protein P7K49_018441 [Saguinus oedipus]
MSQAFIHSIEPTNSSMFKETLPLQCLSILAQVLQPRRRPLPTKAVRHRLHPDVAAPGSKNKSETIPDPREKLQGPSNIVSAIDSFSILVSTGQDTDKAPCERCARGCQEEDGGSRKNYSSSNHVEKAVMPELPDPAAVQTARAQQAGLLPQKPSLVSQRPMVENLKGDVTANERAVGEKLRQGLRVT